MDIFGLVAYVSIGGNKYGFVIVDDYSRYTFVFFMKNKSKVHEIFKKFATRAQNEFDVKIKRVRSDNGTEFKNTNIEDYLDEKGIGHELSVPYTPQQNGLVERKNKTLIEAARTMLDEYKTSDSFWAEAINTACHAINRLYLHKLCHKIAYELLTDKNLTCLTLEFLVVSASFLTRSPKALSLHLKLMKVSSLVTPQTLMAIVSSTRPPVVLKSRVT
jgi:transposase InsO family protein